MRQTLRHATLVLAANRDTAALARRLGAHRVELAMSTALPLNFFPAAYPERPPLAGREPHPVAGPAVSAQGAAPGAGGPRAGRP